MKYMCSISSKECPFDFSEDLERCGFGRDEANDNCPIQKYDPSDRINGKILTLSDWCKYQIETDDEEKWVDIKGFEGIYQVSNIGRVKRLLKCGRNGEKEHLIKPHTTNGYVYVTLSNLPFKKDKPYLLHRLVANAFIPNPNNYSEVNHKDENKLNNSVNNLEWCTRTYNMSYKNARLRQGIGSSNAVNQYTIDGIYLATYASVPIASKINKIDNSGIIKCCNNKAKTAGGYKWRYKQ